MVKKLEDDPDCTSDTKTLIFEKLISIATLPCHTNEQKMQQAYSLKGLMWMK